MLFFLVFIQTDYMQQLDLCLHFALECLCTFSQKQTDDIIRSWLWEMSADFQNFLIFGFSKKFAVKPLSCFPPYVNYVATLPCET